MTLKLLLFLVAAGGLTATILWWRSISTRDEASDSPLLRDDVKTVEHEARVSMNPDKEGFVLSLSGTASLAEERIPLVGRLQTYVRAGSQYATWRQFPEAIRYEVRDPTGAGGMTADHTLNISDSQQSYARYAAEPANQIVGKNFEMNAFPRLFESFSSGPPLIEGPGKYRVRAHYNGHISNWVDIEVGTEGE